MRVPIILLLTLLLISASARGETNEMPASRGTASVSPGGKYSPLTPGEKFKLSLQSTASPLPIAASVFSAGYNQAVDSVPEWGQGMEGYGKRFASSIGQKAISNTIDSGLKILLREDPRYFHSDRQGIRARTLYAIGETFVVHKDYGGTRPNYSWFAGAASGVFLSRRWHPENDRNAEDYIWSAASAIGVQSAKNVFREFWPDIKKIFFKK